MYLDLNGAPESTAIPASIWPDLKHLKPHSETVASFEREKQARASPSVALFIFPPSTHSHPSYTIHLIALPYTILHTCIAITNSLVTSTEIRVVKMPVLDKIKQVFGKDKPEPTFTAGDASNSSTPATTTAAAPVPAPTETPAVVTKETVAAAAASKPVVPESEGVAFDKKDVTVIFVLGGPGAGTSPI